MFLPHPSGHDHIYSQVPQGIASADSLVHVPFHRRESVGAANNQGNDMLQPGVVGSPLGEDLVFDVDARNSGFLT
jgi:hypothetical protein